MRLISPSWRTHRAVLALLVAVIRFVGGQPAMASPCPAAISAAEVSRHIPDEFLSAIARVESGRPDPATGALVPWPWTVNAQGAGAIFATKAQAIAAVRLLQAQGISSIDVGCLQVNLAQHPNAFTSLDQAFDPVANAQFAAGFLASLFSQFHSWPRAAAAYHSQTPTLGTAYQRRVLAEWALPEAADLRGTAAPRRAPQALLPLDSASAKPPQAGKSGYETAGPVFSQAEAMPQRAQRIGGPALLPRGRNLAAYRLHPIRTLH